MVSTGPSGATVIAIDFTLVGIAAVLIAARLYLRLGIQGLSLKASDVLVCAAWIFAVANGSFDIVFYKLGAAKPGISVILEGFDGSLEEAVLVYKLQWVGLFPFYTSFYLSKATLLTLYSYFFPSFMKTRRRILWGTMTYCACAYITTVVVTCVICRPIEANWDPDVVGICDFSAIYLFHVAWALNFAADLMIFFLPFLVIPQLQLRRSVKISVYCTFLLGAINLVFSLTRFLVLQLSMSTSLSLTLIQLWSGLDVNVGLIIACLPALRPYLSHVKKVQHSPSSSGADTKRTGCSEVSETPRQAEFSTP